MKYKISICFLALIILVNCNSKVIKSLDGDSLGECHELGEPFSYPDELKHIAPMRLGREFPEIVSQLCCDGYMVVWAQEGEECKTTLEEEERVVCVNAVNEGECGVGENVCNSTDDCRDPSVPDEELPCMNEGEIFWSTWVSSSSPDFVCCPGLVETEYQYWKEYDDPSDGEGYCFYGYENICIDDCGDGVCGVAENNCICPRDCD
jgi:hypothetical protein